MKGIGTSLAATFSKVRLRCGSGMERCRALAIAALALGAMGLASTANAQETGPTLTDVGVDLVEWVPVVASALGLVILAVLGCYFAFLVIRIGIRFLTRYMK